jgi:hypothetical protein
MGYLRDKIHFAKMKDAILSTLRSKGQYDVPGKEISWKIDSNHLFLDTLVRSGTSIDTLRLECIGRSPQWRISPMGNDNGFHLTCGWDIRLVMPIMFQTLNAKVETVALDKTT